MEKILEEYLKKFHRWETIVIGSYDIDGAVCSVVYYTDVERYYRESKNINIWEMLIFLNAN